MATEDKQQTFGPQTYDFGTSPTQPTQPEPPKPEEESTGLENVLYDKVTMEGAPASPKNVQEVVGQYLDYEAFGRDLFLWDYNMGANNHVFRRV